MANDERFTLDITSLIKQLGQNTYDRARDVYATQRVRDNFEMFQSASQTWHLIGQVLGSHKEVYEVEIDAEITPWGEISSLHSECTCPVGSRCKHAGALLLKAAYRSGGIATNAGGIVTNAPQPKFPTLAPISPLSFAASAAPVTPQSRAEKEVVQWLDLFESNDSVDALIMPGQAADDLEPDDKTGAEQYLYCIASEVQSQAQGGQTRLLMAIKSAKLKANGSWSKPRNVSQYIGTSHANTNQVEKEILQLMRSLSDQAYMGGALKGVLSGKAGALALQMAHATGRLYAWDEERQHIAAPLRLGAKRPARWSWKEISKHGIKEPLWRLQAHAQPSDAPSESTHTEAASQPLVFANDPPLYWDTQTQEIGGIDLGTVSAERFQSLLKSPPIPQSAWLLHEQQMLRHLAGLPLPPFAKAPRDIKGEVPRPILTVTQVEAAHVARWGKLFFTLRFDYAGLEYFSHRMGNPVLVDDEANKERALLHRDTDAETKAIAFLHQHHLQGTANGQFYLPSQHESSQLLWIEWIDAKFALFVQAGFELRVPEEIDLLVRRAEHFQVQIKGSQANLNTTINTTKTIAHDANNTPANTVFDQEFQSPWFDLSLGIEVGGERINILPVLPDLIAQVRMLRARQSADASSQGSKEFSLPEHMFVPHGDQWLRLPTEPLKPWLAALIELLDPDARTKNDVSGDSLRISRFDALRLGAALGEGAVWSGVQGLRELLAKLKGGALALQPVLLPEGLKAELRPYQVQGVSWLQFLREHQLAGVLADDMGLGKTLQTLSHILIEKESGRLNAPALIVAPVSVLGNWLRESAKFTPGLRAHLFHGNERHASLDQLQNADIVLTPYSLLSRDRELWLQSSWSMVVLDEAQNIKNATTDAAQVAYELPARQRICLSGTPMENHLGELWSLFHFLMPGFLGSQRKFKDLYRTPIEKHNDTERMAQLVSRVSPFMLRRTKKAVVQDLPDKIETLSTVQLEGKQADFYETIRLATERSVREALGSRGLARSQIQVLDALLKLRQVCCDPRLVPTPAAQQVGQSAKLEHLMDILPEMIAEGRKVLLFSQFTSMLELIEAELPKHAISWVKLTGQSKKRDEIIDRFTSGEVPLFLISLKAGGVGLNLPQADTVIHYDPWWNPAVENQATDRAHRIGQKNQVFVYKLVARGTIEERMLALQERKAQLSSSMLGGSQMRSQESESGQAMFSEDDVAQLLRPIDA